MRILVFLPVLAALIATNLKADDFNSGSVNLGTRSYTDVSTDLSIPTPIGRMSISRSYGMNGINAWCWEKVDRLNITPTPDGQRIAQLSMGTFKYTESTPDASTLSTGTASSSQKFIFADRTILTTGSGFLWSRPGTAEWVTYDSQGWPTAAGKGTISQVTISTVNNIATWTEVGGDQNDLLTVTYDSDANHNRIKAVAPAGASTVNYEYDSNGLLHRASRGSLQLGLYVYDAGGHITYKATLDGEQFITYNGTIVSSVHDGLGNGESFEFNYDSSTKTYYAKITSSSGMVTEKWLGSNGRLIRRTVNGVTDLIRTSAGQTEIETGPDGSQTLREFDANGNVTREVNPDGGVTTTEYDYSAQKPSKVVTNGVETRYTYDANGNILTHTEAFGTPLQRTGSNEYNALGQITKICHPMGRVITFDYDANCGCLIKESGWLDQNQSTLAYRKSYTYDTRGFMTSGTDSLGRTTSYLFDDNGRKTQEINPEGFKTIYTYTGNNITKVESGVKSGFVSRITRYEYDEANRITATYRTGDSGERLQQKTDYDALGNAIAVTNALGQSTTAKYNDHGSPDQIMRPYKSGITSDTTYQYDQYGRLVLETDPNGVITKTEYDIMGRVARKTEAYGLPEERSIANTYDLNGRLTDVTYTSGTSAYVTQYGYDDLGRKVRVSGDRKLPRAFEFNPDDSLAAEIDGENHRTEYTYSLTASGKSITKTAGVGGDSTTTTTQQDWEGNTTSVVDGAGNRYYFHYNGLNQLTDQSITITNGNSLADGWWNTPASVLAHKDYNAWGQEVASNNILGGSSSAHYDRLGRMVSSTDTNGLNLTYTYDDLDRLIARTYPPVSTANSNRQTQETITYDPIHGHVIALTDRAGSVIQYLGYDLALRSGTTLNPVGGATSYTYDGLGRPITMTDPVGNRTQVQYDAFNNVLQVTYPDNQPGATGTNARIANFTYNRYGQRSDESGAGRYQIHYDYDRAGNLVAMTDGKTPAATTTWSYDAQNRLVSKTYSDNSSTSYTYHPTGLIATRTDAKGQVTQYSYSADGQLTDLTYLTTPADPPVHFDYDSLGNCTCMIDSTGTTGYSYSASGLLLSSTQFAFGTAVSYTYDPEKHRTSMKVTSLGESSITTYSYNEAGQLVQMLDPSVSPTIPFKYGWEPSTQLLTSISTPGGILTEKRFDSAMRLQSISASNAAVSPPILLDSYSYTYDSASQRSSETNRVSETGTNWVRQFEYDQQRQLKDAYRLVPGSTDAHLPTYDFNYKFDPIGNLLLSTTNGASTSYTPNSLNQYSALTPLGQSAFTPAYDLNGNLTAPDHSQTYAFDQENRLTCVTTGSNRVEFTYNGLGWRVEKRVYASPTAATPQKVVHFVYDGPNLIQELELNSSSFILHASYTWGLDLSNTKMGTGGIGNLLAIRIPAGAANAGSYIFNYDGNGNITSLINNADQTISARYEYAPFGETISASGPIASLNPFRFSTKYTDTETGLLYYGCRYYSASSGRWLSRDPIGEQGGVNLYGYVSNNPVSLIDPLGLTPGVTTGMGVSGVGVSGVGGLGAGAPGAGAPGAGAPGAGAPGAGAPGAGGPGTEATMGTLTDGFYVTFGQAVNKRGDEEVKTRTQVGIQVKCSGCKMIRFIQIEKTAGDFEDRWEVDYDIKFSDGRRVTDGYPFYPWQSGGRMFEEILDVPGWEVSWFYRELWYFKSTQFFETCAVCLDDGRVIGCHTWWHTATETGVVERYGSGHWYFNPPSPRFTRITGWE